MDYSIIQAKILLPRNKYRLIKRYLSLGSVGHQIEHFVGAFASAGTVLGRPKHGVASLICMRAKGAAAAAN